MRISLFLVALLSSLQLSLGSKGKDDGGKDDHGHDGHDNDPHACILIAKGHGADDSPRFLSAVQACSEVIIPASTTLNISTRLNMTGLHNKHIVSKSLPFFPVKYLTAPFRTCKGPSVLILIFRIGVETVSPSRSKPKSPSGYSAVKTLFWMEAELLTARARLDWWDTFATNSSLLRPITMTIFQATNVVVKNIKMINSPEWFNLVNEGKNVTYDNININAVSTSTHGPSNTDGWDVYRSDQVTIKNSIINNGDDCVSFKPNSTNILVSNLNCNGSHGISVGSLGQFAGMFDIVENVTSTNVKMSNAQNGARIKAWAGPNVGSGIVKNVTFENFVEFNVDNPVVIDQCYMTNATACAQFPSNTFIQDVVFTNISGTSSGSQVASLACSPDGRCSDIDVENFNLSAPTGPPTFVCQNVNLTGNAADLFPTCTVT
ncbi:Protein kinase domain-containing protein [Mycena venus]|uniref:galacturonan 1,4-alpha-galacturonidase n=1 Tax=Mycena venus TaxID=2733690 RepID=A0A8H7D001_9AGAR|nr:Protein kinase domain-containing protein [Mycena venus]